MKRSPLRRKTPLRAKAALKRGAGFERRSRLKAERFGTRRKPARRSLTAELAYPKPRRAKGTAHSRRPRELGRMCFYRTLPCRVRMAWREIIRCSEYNVLLLPSPLPCDDIIEVMHLGSKRKRGGWRRCDDADTARGCRRHHRDLDGRVGGKAPWYVALGDAGQEMLRARLVELANGSWLALTDDERTWWDAEAVRRLVELRAARRAA